MRRFGFFIANLEHISHCFQFCFCCVLLRAGISLLAITEYSYLQVFCTKSFQKQPLEVLKEGIPRNFAKFTPVPVFLLNFIKKVALAQVFSFQFCEISKKFYRRPPDDCFCLCKIQAKTFMTEFVYGKLSDEENFHNNYLTFNCLCNNGMRLRNKLIKMLILILHAKKDVKT